MNLFWVWSAVAILGLLMVVFGGKKEKGAADYPQAVQWGALKLVVGLFGILSDYMSFTAVMLVFVVLTGVVALIDRKVLAPRRLAAARKAARASGESDEVETPSGGVLTDYSAGFFPVILVVFVLRSFLAEPFTIPSSSMRPGLVVGDFILVNKFIYGLRIPVLNTVFLPVKQVERGDVMVFNYPPEPKINYIKRVIGLPGDTVTYRNKQLLINGRAVPTVADGVYDYVETGTLEMKHNVQFAETQGEHHYRTLNDVTRPPVMLAGVMDFPGRELCQYDDSGFTCKVPEGKYFMMGDNRDNSADGRYWGFVDDHLVVGKAFMIWMNFGDMSRIGKMIR